MAVAYAALLGALALVGAHRLWLLLLLRGAPREGPCPPAPREWPRVTVQLPLYDEASVAARLIDAVAALDYPRDRLEVQVLDDSGDETAAVASERVRHHAATGLSITHVRRGSRAGFKAGALQHGLTSATGELVAIFDADFVPGPSFLRRTVPYFVDPALGLVQARWEHLNRERSLLTRAQALALDAHFRVEQAARSRGGRFFNFNGTAGVFRRAAIEAAGGWTSDTLTEDLDLSLRAQLCGWRFRYVDEVAVPAELPEDPLAWRSQQARWTRGSAQTLRKLLPAVWRAAGPSWRARVEATCQLLLNAAYPLTLGLVLLGPPLVGLGLPAAGALAAVHGALFLLASGAIGAFYVASQRGARARLEAALLVPLLFAFGLGLSLSNGVAWLSGLLREAGTFVRTPKRGDARRRYAPSPALAFGIAEALLAAWAAWGVWLALASGRALAAPFLLLVVVGFALAAAGALTPRLLTPRP